MKTKIRQSSFSPRGNILGLIDAAHLQRRSTDSVMIPADVLTTHFGIHRRCAASQLRCRSSDAVIKLVLRCCLYWPNRWGWRQKVIMPLTTFMKRSWWCLLGQGKWHLPAKEYIITNVFWPRVRARALHAPVRCTHPSFWAHYHTKQGAARPPLPSQLRCFLLIPQNYKLTNFQEQNASL